uniref:Uncharacterized protein n=1 Tax=viral metagenome TaxID=1070528 RepID=A0A6M3JNX2_9ZZZZ
MHELEDAHNDLMHVLAEEFGFALTSRLHSNSYLLDFQRAPVKQAEHLMTTRGSLTPKGE